MDNLSLPDAGGTPRDRDAGNDWFDEPEPEQQSAAVASRDLARHVFELGCALNRAAAERLQKEVA